jgi:hypothetical protein
MRILKVVTGRFCSLLLSFFYHWPSFGLFGLIILGGLSSGLSNTMPLGNSLRFLMVHFTTPNGQQIRSYDYRNMAGLLNSGKLGQT